MCIALCTIVVHNIAQNRPDNFPSYHPDSHHCSSDVYLREGRALVSDIAVFVLKRGVELQPMNQPFMSTKRYDSRVHARCYPDELVLDGAAVDCLPTLVVIADLC